MALSNILTLTTDFGSGDFYVAALKAVLLHHRPGAVLVDVSHEVPPQDITAGAFLVERAVASFPEGTVHLAVVDPEVGTSRLLIIAQIDSSFVVCPDNGLITWAWRRSKAQRAWVIDWRPGDFSSTFHGRDVMAPIAGQLANGRTPSVFGRSLDNPVLLDQLKVTDDPHKATVIHVDHFGNCTTNLPGDRMMRDTRHWFFNNQDLGPLRKTYADVEHNRPLALLGSSGLLEIAVRNGSAAAELNLSVGAAVEARA